MLGEWGGGGGGGKRQWGEKGRVGGRKTLIISASSQLWLGLCHVVLETCTLFANKACDCPHSLLDLHDL